MQGFLTEIKYTDGAAVKKGEHLFTIEPEPYRLKLQQAQAAEASAEATVKQTEADFERQQELVQRQAASKAAFDNSTANRDIAKARLLQARADTSQAKINLDYTEIHSPIDGKIGRTAVTDGNVVTPSSAATSSTSGGSTASGTWPALRTTAW